MKRACLPIVLVGLLSVLARGQGMDVEFRLVARPTPSSFSTTTVLPASSPRFVVGSSYTLEIWGSDVTQGAGFTCVFLDLNWDPGVATATGFSHGSIFTFLSTGTLLPGALDEFGGCSFTPYGVAPEWVRIGYLSVTASALGTVTYDLNPSTSGVSLFGHGTVPWGTIYLDMLPTEHSPDCNGNGIPDIDDILAGTSADCDLDGVPDECQVDSDGDGVIDPCDGCPADPAKTDPGICGCGVADTDTDSDGTPDCLDGCPTDPAKIDPGI